MVRLGWGVHFKNFKGPDTCLETRQEKLEYLYLLAPGSLGRYSCFSTPPVCGPGRGGQSPLASWRSERAALSCEETARWT